MNLTIPVPITDSAATGNPGKTGLTPTWVFLKKLADNSDVSQPSITEVADGVYKFAFDAEANGECVGQIDAGSALVNAFDRYVYVHLQRDGTRIQSGISNIGQVTVGGYASGQTPQLAGPSIS